MRPNKVETRLQLHNGLVKVQKLVGKLAIGWVKRFSWRGVAISLRSNFIF